RPRRVSAAAFRPTRDSRRACRASASASKRKRRTRVCSARRHSRLRRVLPHATKLALRAARTEDWRVVVVFLILLPMAVIAWLKISPIAGVIAVAWLLFVAF